MCNDNKHIITLTISFIASIIIFSMSKLIDGDIKMSTEAFFNIIILIFIVYLLQLSYLLYKKYKTKQMISKQIALINNDFMIEEFKNNELIKHLFLRNQELHQNIYDMNELQTKWIHDIKIPLSTLKLFITNRNNILSSEDALILSRIALDIENQINNKMIYDKLQLSSHDLIIEKVNLYDIIKKVIKNQQPIFMMKKMTIKLNVDKDAKVLSDEKTLRYAIEQIIANALKYSDNNTSIEIDFKNNNLYIKDYGWGIDSQDKSRLFEHGYTGKNGKEKGNAASGMGLFLTRKSLHYIGHDIYFETREDGTTFIINLGKVTNL